MQYINNVDKEISKWEDIIKNAQKQIDWLNEQKENATKCPDIYNNKCYITEIHEDYITYTLIKNAHRIEDCSFDESIWIDASVLNVEVWNDGTYGVINDVNDHICTRYYNHQTKEYEKIQEIDRSEFDKILKDAISSFKSF